MNWEKAGGIASDNSPSVIQSMPSASAAARLWPPFIYMSRVPRPTAPRVAAVDAYHRPLVMPAFRRLDWEAAFEQSMALQLTTP
jgi:hypothetical protein